MNEKVDLKLKQTVMNIVLSLIIFTEVNVFITTPYAKVLEISTIIYLTVLSSFSDRHLTSLRDFLISILTLVLLMQLPNSLEDIPKVVLTIIAVICCVSCFIRVVVTHHIETETETETD